SWDLRDEIGVYPKPLLLAMAGRDDSIVPPAVMDDVAGHHPANVQIETFEGQGHSLHRTDFETFAVVLERFLKRVT
ncbi:MAG TPA: alpha/beta hydrolase, partial [Candidatus Aquilonibacter sp.]|nr:alpha/beta hydrolase [Candidatus Aquilonibacter sp.]